ncbi:hypothetical protein GOV08_02575 [Candidatus Woesearchaeota archaeon]|nr:hypothetical protein [Candidatus Woesearchaeota archaeon]
MNIECVQCKGRNFCGRTFCPLITKISAQKKANLNLKKDYFGEAPSIFVGRYGYPDVNVGFLSTEDYTEQDAPIDWTIKGYDIQKIIDLRTQLINSNFKANIKSFDEKLIDMGKEVAMATKPVDVEINLEKKPEFSLTFNQDIMPHGPSTKLKKAEITENPKIPTKVDKITSDTDLKAEQGLSTLFKKGFDEHYLKDILSIGNLGTKEKRRMVPTRWAITAVDDTLGKDIFKEIREYNEISDFKAYFGGNLGNYFLILMFPEVWSYELFEMHVDSQKYMHDVEGFNGRTSYATETAGGYYACRLAILERFKHEKRQGFALALRFITNDYWAPLGVWVVREAVRNAMRSKPVLFETKEKMLEYAKKIFKKKFSYELNLILKNSKLLHEHKTQKKLWEF